MTVGIDYTKVKTIASDLRTVSTNILPTSLNNFKFSMPLCTSKYNEGLKSSTQNWKSIFTSADKYFESAQNILKGVNDQINFEADELEKANQEYGEEDSNTAEDAETQKDEYEEETSDEDDMSKQGEDNEFKEAASESVVFTSEDGRYSLTLADITNAGTSSVIAGTLLDTKTGEKTDVKVNVGDDKDATDTTDSSDTSTDSSVSRDDIKTQVDSIIDNSTTLSDTDKETLKTWVDDVSKNGYNSDTLEKALNSMQQNGSITEKQKEAILSGTNDYVKKITGAGTTTATGTASATTAGTSVPTSGTGDITITIGDQTFKLSGAGTTATQAASTAGTGVDTVSATTGIASNAGASVAGVTTETAGTAAADAVTSVAAASNVSQPDLVTAVSEVGQNAVANAKKLGASDTEVNGIYDFFKNMVEGISKNKTLKSMTANLGNVAVKNAGVGAAFAIPLAGMSINSIYRKKKEKKFEEEQGKIDLNDVNNDKLASSITFDPNSSSTNNSDEYFHI